MDSTMSDLQTVKKSQRRAKSQTTRIYNKVIREKKTSSSLKPNNKKRQCWKIYALTGNNTTRLRQKLRRLLMMMKRKIYKQADLKLKKCMFLQPFRNG